LRETIAFLVVKYAFDGIFSPDPDIAGDPATFALFGGCGV
jgi:hypothetical protein